MEKEETKKYQRLLIRYFKEQQPEKLKYQPKVIEVNQDQLVFGMTKHMGVFSFHKDYLIKFI